MARLGSVFPQDRSKLSRSLSRYFREHGEVMDILFRRQAMGEMERPPTQRDQFNNDDVDLVDALVREAIQNSLDARLNEEQVKVAFNFKDLHGESLSEARGLLSLRELDFHLKSSGIAFDVLEAERMSILTVEDFGTTGLKGATHSWDKKPFCDFWRRMGVSNKTGKSLGRWGLGKLVFSSSSNARIFLGYTVRSDDPGNGYLMGQAVLTTHQDEQGNRYDSHGFYAVKGPEELQVPETNAEVLDAARRVFSLTRVNEPGLSVIIPFVDASINQEKILRGVVRNYFFPVLTGQLRVAVGSVEVTAESFPELAKKFGDARFTDGKFANFISSVEQARSSRFVALDLPSNWAKQGPDQFLKENAETLRATIADGELVHIRAPMVLKRQTGEELQTFVECFIKKADTQGAEPLFVRDTIVLPAETKYFKGKDVYAALVARDRAVCDFLGDAENPAHTSWSASAEKLAHKWRNPAERLREVRQVLQKIYSVLSAAIETVDEDALVEVFGIPSTDGSAGPGKKGKKESSPPPEIAEKDRRKFRINRLAGGFEIKSGPGLEADDLPLMIKVKAAYDVLRGNPFKKYDELDFHFDKSPIKYLCHGAELKVEAPNAFVVEVSDVNFNVAVSGFDPNRDLIVDPARVR